ncbi:MAG: hypothetical protein ACJ76F_05460 [Bacteroidia bacterium]
MRWNKVILFFLVLSLGLVLPTYAQKKHRGENHSPFGRKKKEKHNQHARRSGGGLFRKGRSKGNADAFASHSISGRRGFISRIFHGNGSGTRNASLRKTKPGKVQNREQSGLFHRSRTKNKMNHEKIHRSQRKERKNKRVRGNSVFHKRRH